MQVYARALVDDILNKANRQFVVPIYQRPYTWQKDQCDRLLDDIYNSAQNQKEHFLGCIVHQQEKDMDVNNMKLYLVDGQQRITTIMLIAKALNLIAINIYPNDENAIYVSKKTNELIYIDRDEAKKGYKLKTSYYDEKHFHEIMTCNDLKILEDNNSKNNIKTNFIHIYNSLLDEIKNKKKDIRSDIYNGLLELKIVEIQLSTIDNPQEIFESINSLGIKLTAVDSIKNYLFLNNDSKELFEEKWKPMQDKLIEYENIEDFIMHYLVWKHEGTNVKKKNLYEEYINFAKEELAKDKTKQDLINDLYDAAEVYEVLLHKSKNYNDTINNLTQEFRDLGQTTSYAFLLRVLLDYKNKLINDDELAKIINFILVFIVRRLICEVANNLLRPLMFGLYDKLFKKNPQNKKNYYETIYNSLINSKNDDRMPTDSEVKQKLLTLDLYDNKKLCKSLLFKIENGRYPHIYHEYVSIKEVSIEHIIPIELTEEWKQDLGENYLEIHNKYLHTLGNLSLSSVQKNSKMSNHSFLQKKKILLSDESKFNVLNKMLEKLDKFTEQDLINRTNELTQKVIERYDFFKPNINK